MLEEAGLAFHSDTLGQVTGACRSHDVFKFLFHCQFVGTVEPFDHGTHTFAFGTVYRVCGEREGKVAEFDLAVYRTGHCRDHALLMTRVLVEAVDVAADQFGGVETRDRPRNFALVAREQSLDGLVHVDDVVVGVCHHDAARYVIECGTDTHVFRSLTLFHLAAFRFGALGGAQCGEICPLDNGTQTLTFIADYRVRDDLEGTRTHLHLAGEGISQLRQQATLMGRILVEDIDVVAQDIVGIELRQDLFQVGLRVLEHLRNSVVHVGHVVLGVRHHHVGRRAVERGLHTRRFLGAPLSVGDLEAQLDLRRTDCLLDLANRAPFAGVCPIEVVADDELSQLACCDLQRRDHVLLDQECRTDARADDGEQGGIQDTAGHAYGEQHHGKNRQRSHTARARCQQAFHRPGRARLKRRRQRGLAGAYLGIQSLGGALFVSGGLGAYRHVFDAAVCQGYRRHVGAHPVVIAVLGAVLHQPGPGATCLDGFPEILERRRRHIGMTHQVVVAPDQLLLGESADRDERGVGVSDDALMVCL